MQGFAHSRGSDSKPPRGPEGLKVNLSYVNPTHTQGDIGLIRLCFCKSACLKVQATCGSGEVCSLFCIELEHQHGQADSPSRIAACVDQFSLCLSSRWFG